MVIRMSIKTYSELITIPTYKERFQYLQLKGTVGKETFGYDRYLNQVLYNSPEWKRFRNDIVIRDNGCDLACDGYEINGWKSPSGKIHRARIIIHHMNPITVEDVINRNPMVFDPENVITTTLNTHNAIHYGDENLLVTGPINRSANDTCPWQK